MPASPSGGIALALGGGAALGWAHIGALRVLEEAKVPIRAVAGTSMGALAGLCFAAGRLDVFEAIALGFTRRRFWSYFDLQLARGALIRGKRIQREIEAHFGAVRLEDLPIPLSIVATDIAAVEEVRFTRGLAAPVVRASTALPGLFNPVELDGRVLIDGGCFAILPVGAARALAPAAPLVAVDLVGDFRGVPARPTSALGTIRAGFLTTMTQQVRQSLAIDPADVLIRPAVRHLSPGHFHRAREFIAIGREAAEAALPQIQARLSA